MLNTKHHLKCFRRVDVTQSTTVVAEAGGETILKCTSASTSRGSNNNSSLSSDTSLSNESCSWELNGKKIQQNSSRHSFGFDESQVWLVTLPSQQTVPNCPSRSVNWGYIQSWRATLVNMLVNTANLTTNQVSSKWWAFTWQWCHPYNFTMVLGESAWAAAYQSGHWRRSCWSWPRGTSPGRSSRPGDLFSSQQHWWSKIGVGHWWY